MGTIRWRGHISPLVICHVVTSWTGKPPCLKTLVNPQKYVVSSLVAEPDGFQCFTCFIQVIEFFHDPFLTNIRCPLETLRSPWFTLWLFNIDMVATVHLWIVHRHSHWIWSFSSSLWYIYRCFTCIIHGFTYKTWRVLLIFFEPKRFGDLVGLTYCRWFNI